ncbi:MAG: hypothetical protein DMD83_08345 [Candidatus Rokuibacteriota bacterium]|nr:MAG: hypothetical protein DMD83_08345 [Candidatus Rokubacteria bacterium]
MAEIRRKVADSLPHRLGFLRGAVLEPIETYQEFIPDEVLLKYDGAGKLQGPVRASGLTPEGRGPLHWSPVSRRWARTSGHERTSIASNCCAIPMRKIR